MVKEIWKDIKDYDGVYQVNNLGKVKSKKNNKEIILKGGQTPKNYKQVELYKNGKCKIFYIHRLVAEAFIPNPNNFPLINHKDENKENNCVENLEWCNNSYNLMYGNTQNNKKREILQYDIDNKFIRKWNSIMQVERELNIKNNNIVSCCKGKRQSAGGFIWRYANEK